MPSNKIDYLLMQEQPSKALGFTLMELMTMSSTFKGASNYEY
jgi:hypothetical protein